MKPLYQLFPLALLSAAVHNAHAEVTAVDDFFTVTAGSTGIILDVLANDSTTNEGASLWIEFFPSITTAYGTLVLNNDQTLTYTPPDDFIGTDTFFYEVYDDFGYGEEAIVTIQIVESREPDYSLAGQVQRPADRLVASRLDRLCFEGELFESEGDASRCQTFRMFENPDDLRTAISEITPDELMAPSRLMLESSRNRSSRLSRGIAQARRGSSVSLGVNQTTLPLGGAAGDGFASPWTLISSIQYEDTQYQGSDYDAAYEATSKGLLFGVGYRAAPGMLLGAAIDWHDHSLDYRQNAGSLDADSLGFTGFLSLQKEQIIFDLQAGYGSGSNSSLRRFTLPEEAYARGKFNSRMKDFSMQLEIANQVGPWAWHPFIRMAYHGVNVSGFTETGDSLWLMQVSEQRQSQVNSSLGLDTRYNLPLSWGVLVPALRLSAVSQTPNRNNAVTFSLADDESAFGSFTLHSAMPDKLFYQWELSTVAVLPGGISAFFAAQTLSGYSNTRSRQLSAGVNWEF